MNTMNAQKIVDMMNSLSKMNGIDPFNASEAFESLRNILNEAGYDVDEVGDGNLYLTYL